MRAFVVLVVIVVLGAALRVHAAATLPTGQDEPKYLWSAYVYAVALQSGDLEGIVEYGRNLTHPALPKLLFGAAVLLWGGPTEPEQALGPSRAVSVGFSTLALLLVALMSPLAAALLAIHTLLVQASSVAIIEAIPLAASVAVVLAFRRAADPRDRWFWLSAAALGLTAAGKYTYLLPVISVTLYLALAEHGPRWRAAAAAKGDRLPWRALTPYVVLIPACAVVLLAVGRAHNLPFLLPIVGYALWEKWAGRRALVSTPPTWLPWRTMLPYFGVAVLVFWLFNPTLWHEPRARLAAPFANQARYLQSGHVEEWALPWYMPIAWLTLPLPALAYPGEFAYPPPDAAIFLLALIGIKREWRERRWLVVWIGTGLIFALLWPAKFPQYCLPIVPPLCLMAAPTLTHLWRRFLLRSRAASVLRFGRRGVGA